MSRDKVEIEKTWSIGRSTIRRCRLSTGEVAASLFRDGTVLLWRPLDRIIGIHDSEGMPYDEAQLLLACHDLTLPPLPEDMS